MSTTDRGMWRSRWAAIGAAVAVTLGAGAAVRFASADVGAGDHLVSHPVPTCRLLDTKAGLQRPTKLALATAETSTFTVEGNCGIPADAKTVDLLVTIISGSSSGEVTFWPAGEAKPVRSNMASLTTKKQSTPTVELSADGKISVFNLKSKTHLAVDVTGYSTDHDHDDRYYNKNQVDAAVDAARLGKPGFTMTVVDDPAHSVGAYSSMAIGTDGLPIISYQDVTAGTLKVAHCENIACTEATITTVDDPSDYVGAYSSLAIGADGLPIIVYQNATKFGLVVAHCNDVACTGNDETKTRVSSLFANQYGIDMSIAVGGDGLPVVSFRNGTTQAVLVLHCNDIACTGLDETVTELSATSSLGTAIAIGIDGYPVITYYDPDNGSNVAVFVCSSADCTSGASTFPDNSGIHISGSQSAATIGDDGFPVIATQEETDLALRIVHCSDPACTAATATDADDPANLVGGWAAITIGADGFPVVSHYDAGASALRVTHCNDIACAGGDETSVDVDDVDNQVGTYSSITIGVDGLPIISYADQTDGSLKVVHCANVSCFPDFRRR